MSTAKTLTKNEIIETLHSRLQHEVPKSTISAVCDEYARLALDTLKDGNSFPIGRLGKFEVGETSARKGRNPATGEAIEIKASKRVKFKSGQVAKRELNGG